MPQHIHTLCLSGWAQHHDALIHLCDNHKKTLHFSYAHLQDSTDALAMLALQAPVTQRIIGWSLGGALAMRALSEGHIRTQQLVLLAAPVQFVACTSFTHGMDQLTFSLFHQNYGQDSLRTAKRFSHLITKGDKHHAHITPSLAPADFSAQHEVWHRWLDELHQQHHTHHNFSHFPPTLIIHGEQDSIVSIEQSQWLAQAIPNATLMMLPDCGHAPHLHNSAAIIDAMEHHKQAHCK